LMIEVKGSNQKYLKFPLTPPSPQRGGGKGEGPKMLEENSQSYIRKNLNE
jgi:hypothetical protein